MSEKVFAFDIGTGSLGIAVREGKEIIEARSLLIHPEFASTKEQRERRRQHRTRIAHKSREQFLKEQCRKAGIEVLEGRKPGNKKKGIPPRKGDPRLETEFAPAGDNTVYTSCLLRIMLLQGERLEGWQVYKALHSAIQRRGYDPDILWKSGEKQSKKDDEKETLKNMNEYKSELEKIAGGKNGYTYPCYYDAKKMGLWDAVNGIKNLSPTHESLRARGYTAPRTLVEKEVRALLNAASRLYPGLGGKADYILYGPAGKPYASYNPDIRKQYGLREGSISDWQGVLSQKIPRFDNRCVDSCALIPRFNVCRSQDHLVMQVTFLMKLVNMRYMDSTHHEQQLTPDDIRSIFKEKTKSASELKKKLQSEGKKGKEIEGKIADTYKFTPSKWKTWLKNTKNGLPLVNQEVIEAPKISGRARYSRPALRIMRDFILSGQSPHAFYETQSFAIKNDDLKRGIVIEDLQFLKRMPDEWEKIHVPDRTVAEKYFGDDGDVERAVRNLISCQRNPVIRHRMEVFCKYLDIIEDRYGIPDKVMIELVREGFMSAKAKYELEKRQLENRKKRDEARKKAAELGVKGFKSRMKLILLKQQNYKCLYTGEPLSENDIENYEIDHAVPRGGIYNGSDSMYNRVLTKRVTNQKKGDRTPYQFLVEKGEWYAFCERVKGNLAALGRKKAMLLTSEHPEELDEKYTSLAETAWIARIARDIVCLKFGWQYGEKGKEERALVVDGALTANVRRHYGLNSLLADPNETDPEKIEQKNRADDRHHALDAMVLSYITRNRPELPEGVNKEYFREVIESVVPEQIAFEKPKLEETIYAKRLVQTGKMFKECIVKREKLSDLALDKGKYSLDKAKKNIQSTVDAKIRTRIKSFLETNPDKAAWDAFIGDLRQSERGGSRVLKVAVIVGEPEEYRDFSKNDGRGQYRRAAKHWGQYLYLDEKGKPKVCPVYAYESKRVVYGELKKNNYTIIDFFKAGCLVELEKDLSLSNRIIPAGKYRLGSLWTSGFVKLVSTLPELKNPIGIANLLSAGFKRVR